MADNITPEEFKNLGPHMGSVIKDCLAGIELFAATQAKALHKRKIFNKSGSEDSSGSKLRSPSNDKQGAYSKGYAKVRAEDGRQFRQVDLQKTDQLFRSFDTGQVNGKPAYGIVIEGRGKGQSNSQIFDHLSEIYSTDLGLSDSDANKVADLALKRLDKCFTSKI